MRAREHAESIAFYRGDVQVWKGRKNVWILCGCAPRLCYAVPGAWPPSARPLTGSVSPACTAHCTAYVPLRKKHAPLPPTSSYYPLRLPHLYCPGAGACLGARPLRGCTAYCTRANQVERLVGSGEGGGERGPNVREPAEGGGKGWREGTAGLDLWSTHCTTWERPGMPSLTGDVHNMHMLTFNL